MDYELSKVITWYEKRKDLFDTIKEIGDDMELENNDDKFNIEKTGNFKFDTSSCRWNGLVRYESTFIAVAR